MTFYSTYFYLHNKSMFVVKAILLINILINFPLNAFADETINFRVDNQVVRLTNLMELTPSQTENIWVNGDQYLKLEINRIHSSKQDAISEYLDFVSSSPNLFLYKNKAEVDSDSDHIIVKTLVSSTKYMIHTIFVENNGALTKLRFSYPESNHKILTKKLFNMLNTMEWGYVSSSNVYNNLPFEYSIWPGFIVKQKYQNSLVLVNEETNNTYPNTTIVISYINDKSQKGASIANSEAILLKAKSLEQVNIISSEETSLNSMFSVTTKATAELKNKTKSSEYVSIDLVQRTLSQNQHFLVAQIFTRKNSQSLTKLQDALDNYLIGVKFRK